MCHGGRGGPHAGRWGWVAHMVADAPELAGASLLAPDEDAPFKHPAVQRFFASTLTLVRVGRGACRGAAVVVLLRARCQWSFGSRSAGAACGNWPQAIPGGVGVWSILPEVLMTVRWANIVPAGRTVRPGRCTRFRSSSGRRAEAKCCGGRAVLAGRSARCQDWRCCRYRQVDRAGGWRRVLAIQATSRRRDAGRNIWWQRRESGTVTAGLPDVADREHLRSRTCRAEESSRRRGRSPCGGCVEQAAELSLAG